MLTTIIALSLLGQCSGAPGSTCAMPQARFAQAQQFYYAPQTYAAPAAPQLHRLPDADGTVYQHTDRAFLQGWLTARNEAMAKAAKPLPTAIPPPKVDVPPLCPCALGRCPCEAKAAKAASIQTPLTGDILAIGPPPPSPW